MVSKALVISAENNFETANPSYQKRRKKSPNFSKEYTEAHELHKKVCDAWRKEGRPAKSSHSAKDAVLVSRRKLQKNSKR